METLKYNLNDGLARILPPTSFSSLRARQYLTTALALLASLGVSACGGGGTSSTGSSSGGSNTNTNTDTTVTDDSADDTALEDDIDDVIAGLDFGGGAVGGGGGGVGIPSPPAAASDELTLYKSGSNYATTSVMGSLWSAAVPITVLRIRQAMPIRSSLMPVVLGSLHLTLLTQMMWLH